MKTFEDKKINLAVIGCGYWGKNLIRNFRSLPGCRIHVLCDQSEELLQKYRFEVGGHCLFTKDTEKAIKDTDVDAVVISTPIDTHYFLVKLALNEGKHVLVEKPLTDDLDKASELKALAEEKECILCVDHTFLYSPPVNRIREMILNKDLGELHYINMTRVNLGVHSSSSSVLWDLASHDLSILLYWLDELPCEVSVRGRNCLNHELHDLAYLNLSFPCGVMANLHVSWLSPGKFRNTVVVGRDKMIVYDDTKSDEKIRIYSHGIEPKAPRDFGEYQLTYNTGDVCIPNLSNEEPLRIFCSHFLDCLIEGKRPLTHEGFGWSIVNILHHAEESLQQNGMCQKITWE